MPDYIDPNGKRFNLATGRNWRHPDGTCYPLNRMSDEELTAIGVTRSLPTPHPVPTPEEILARETDLLWDAANSYQEARISGGALILVDRLIRAGNAKAQAVDAWVTGLWQEYYSRKAQLQAGEPLSQDPTTLEDPTSATSMLDFSDLGEMPYSVGELMQEAGL